MRKVLVFLFLFGLYGAGMVRAEIGRGETGSIMWILDDNGDFSLSGTNEIPAYFIHHEDFSNFKSYILNVVIEDGITGIGNDAFSESGITTVSIPATVTYIGERAFMNCTELTCVTIPYSVTYIGNEAFNFCISLSEIVNYSLIPQEISPETFFYSHFSPGTLWVPAGSEERYKSNDQWGEFMIHIIEDSGVTGAVEWVLFKDVLVVGGRGDIPMYFLDAVFPDVNRVRSVVMYDGITGIAGFAFMRGSITSISVPASVATISTLAFWYCEGLTSITVDKTNPYFYDLDGILVKSITHTLVAVPAGKSGDLTIPEPVLIIGEYAFYDCVHLTSIDIPSSVILIGVNAFLYCEKLTNITVQPGNSAYSSVDGVLFDSSKQTLVAFPPGRSGSYIVPGTVKIIGGSSFSSCTGLTSVILPASLITIDAAAFSSCGLTSIILPPSIQNIYKNAFSNCIHLSNVVNLSPGPQNIDAGTFPGSIFPSCTLWVPATSVGNYQSANEWMNFKNIKGTSATTENGSSTIAGVINNAGLEEVTVNLYINLDTETKQGTWPKKLVGTHVLINTAKVAAGSNQYRFDNLPAGFYVVEVVIDGFKSDSSEEINLSAEEICAGINFTVDGGTIIAEPIISGMEDLPVGANVKIYPNPFAGILCFEGAERCTLKIFAADGRLVYVQTVTDARETIRLEHLPAGMYIIRLENSGRSKTMKAIKIQ